MQSFEFRGPRGIDAPGRFITYQECTTPDRPPAVRLYVAGQLVGVLLPGETLEVEREANRWNLEPVDGNCAGRVFIGARQFQTLRSPPNEQAGRAVSEVAAGKHFVGAIGRVAAAGLFSAVGLVTLNRTAIVYRVAVHGGSFARVIYGQGQPSAPLLQRVGSNKDPELAGADASFFNFDAVATTGPVTGVTLGADIDSFTNGASAPIEWITGAPIILPPGWGLWFLSGAAATNLSVRCEWQEV